MASSCFGLMTLDAVDAMSSAMVGIRTVTARDSSACMVGLTFSAAFDVSRAATFCSRHPTSMVTTESSTTEIVRMSTEVMCMSGLRELVDRVQCLSQRCQRILDELGRERG